MSYLLHEFNRFPVALFQNFTVLENATIKFRTFWVYQDLYKPWYINTINEIKTTYNNLVHLALSSADCSFSIISNSFASNSWLLLSNFLFSSWSWPILDWASLKVSALCLREHSSFSPISLLFFKNKRNKRLSKHEHMVYTLVDIHTVMTNEARECFNLILLHFNYI